MPGITGALTSKVLAHLTEPNYGIAARLAQLAELNTGTPSVSSIRTFTAQNATVDTSEKGGVGHYPALYVYCDKLQNTMREKFRQFSGSAHLVVDVRHSQDRLDDIESRLQVYVDSVCALLDDLRGDWGDGVFYTGGYEVAYDAVGRGGKNFLQRAKVGFQVEVSK